MPDLKTGKRKERMRKTIRFIDMFAGIGGFREGFGRAGGFECVGYCERDQYALRSYRALFDTEGEWYCDDARKMQPDDMPGFDLLCGGFPCQTFSVAGKRAGFSAIHPNPHWGWVPHDES